MTDTSTGGGGSPRLERRPGPALIMMLLGVLLVLMLTARLGQSCLSLPGDAVPPTESDYEALLTMEDVQRVLPEASLLREAEEMVRRDVDTGDFALHYTYRTSDEAPSVHSGLRVFADVEKARSWQAGQSSGVREVLEDEGFTLTEEPSLAAWGESPTAVSLTRGGKPAGLYFIARKERRVAYALVKGFAVDAERARALLAPVLERMATYQPPPAALPQP